MWVEKWFIQSKEICLQLRKKIPNVLYDIIVDLKNTQLLSIPVDKKGGFSLWQVFRKKSMIDDRYR